MISLNQALDERDVALQKAADRLQEILDLRADLARLRGEMKEVQDHSDRICRAHGIRLGQLGEMEKERAEAHAAIRALNDGLDELCANEFPPKWVAQQIAEVQRKHAPAIRAAMGEGK